MTMLDFVEAWWLSTSPLLNAAGVTGQFQRTTDDRLNPSCNLNLRRGSLEVDLSVWESGEAELATLGHDGIVQQKHYDNVRNQENLVEILSQMSFMANS